MEGNGASHASGDISHKLGQAERKTKKQQVKKIKLLSDKELTSFACIIVMKTEIGHGL